MVYREIRSFACRLKSMGNEKQLILLRGLPGSGKSTLAEAMAQEVPGSVVVTTDAPIEDVPESYLSPFRMGLAYGLACADTRRAVAQSAPRIIVDHTNARNWEMGGFARIALQKGYSVAVVEPQTPWAHSVKDCFTNSSHAGIEEEDVANLKAAFEPLLPLEEMVKAQTPSERLAECQAVMERIASEKDPEIKTELTRAVLLNYPDVLVMAVRSTRLPIIPDVTEAMERLRNSIPTKSYHPAEPTPGQTDQLMDQLSASVNKESPEQSPGDR